MIKFFRRIRQQLLSENKFSKYLLYAIGEIVLVVIGIFLAIQLNQWNQGRIEQKQDSIMLQNLKVEFMRTQKLLDTIFKDYNRSIDANLLLMKQFSSAPDGLSDRQLDTLLVDCSGQAPFYPPQPVLDEVLNSGKIKTLSNEQLKQHLFDWESTIRWFYFDYDLFINFSNSEFQPYLNKHWSWKNIDLAGGSPFYKERSLFQVDSGDLFKSMEFENLVGSNLFHTNRLRTRLEAIDRILDRILTEIAVSLEH